MNTNALRQKILDLAIHGKLVKQDPADESATILLEKIRAEKEKKIASGELKRGKNDSYIFFGDDNRHYEKFADGRVKDIEDEIPFAVPEGWAWCRLGEISSELGDGIHGTPEYTQNGSCYFINGTNLLNGKIIIKQETKTVDEEQYEKYKKDLSPNTMFISINGTLGNIAFYNNEHIILGKSVCYFNLVNEKFKYFFYFLFNGHYFQKYVEVSATGSTIKNVSLKAMNRFLIPLPPLAEQQRIVDTIEAIFAQIDLLKQNKVDLQTAVKQAKSKILDLAIRGKLVPQDPADEPASVMLEKLHAEKEAKIASGEIKRGKNDSYIYKNSTDNCYYQKYTDGCEENISDEIPFDVSEGWTWYRLGEIYYHTTGKALKKSNEKGSLKKYITTSNLYWDTFDLSEVRTMYFTDDELDKYTIKKGDLVLCNGGDVGRAAIWSYDKDICYQNHISRMRPKTNGIENRFFLYVLMFYKEENMLNGKGIGISSLSASDLLSIIIPLPPLAEQPRIVTKIEELFAQLNFITTTLTK